jgi:hypothetical protein
MERRTLAELLVRLFEGRGYQVTLRDNLSRRVRAFTESGGYLFALRPD